MRRFLSCLILPLFMTACGSAANQTPAEPAGNDKPSPTITTQGATGKTPTVFAFGWKLPCRVPVEQLADKKGHKMKMRYMLSVKPGPEGKIDADMSDFEFLEMDGHDLTTPAMQEKLAPALALTTAMPTMVISPEGEYLGMRNLDQMVDRVIAFSRKTKGWSKAESDRVGAMMRSPTMMATLENKVGDYWNSWVGAWVGLELAPSESREGDDAITLGKEEIPVHIRYENHGPIEGASGLVRVSLTSTYGGNSASTGLLAFMRGMMKEGGMDLPGDMAIDYANIVNKIEVETEPATLRPRHARSTRAMEIVIKGERVARKEVREETFDWEHAQGCRP